MTPLTNFQLCRRFAWPMFAQALTAFNALVYFRAHDAVWGGINLVLALLFTLSLHRKLTDWKTPYEPQPVLPPDA